MLAIDVLEERRTLVQSKLDSAKTPVERNRLGQFATPFPLARSILDYASQLLDAQRSIRFLDPALGTGAFYSALMSVIPSERLDKAMGYEIDPAYAEAARSLWPDLDIQASDFTLAKAPSDERDRFNLVVCNPPYVRHHHLSLEMKQRLKTLVNERIGLRLNGLAGLYIYFLCLAHDWLADDGLALWLIPGEFMDVNYGRELKSYLLKEVQLIRVHRFDPQELQFGDALVSSSLVCFRKQPASQKQTIVFSFGGSLQQPQDVEEVNPSDLIGEKKWSAFPRTHRQSYSKQAEARLGDFFEVRRGVATGANDFFILSPEQIEAHRLPMGFLRPIIPSPRYLPENVIEADEAGTPQIKQLRYLLTCDLSPAQIEAQHPDLWAYLLWGMERGIHLGYLCRHRSLWYRQEQREPAPILCTYMGRKGRRSPLRFILNHSKAIAPNVYLNLYPKPVLTDRLPDKPELIQEIWETLNTIPLEARLAEGRVYGGGLHKIEPQELAKLSVPFALNN